jgi:hypothetical protein
VRALVAPIAEGHNDPIVRAVADFVPTLYARRRSLQVPHFDRDGGLVMPAMPELLKRLPRARGPKKGAIGYWRKGQWIEQSAAFDFRRADGMAAICRVLTALVAWCQWTTQEVRDPKHGYLSVARLALEALCSIDQVERALGWLRAAGIVCKTVQFREEKPDGTYHSTGPALRKLAVWWFDSIPSVRRVFHHRRNKLKAKYGKRRAAAARQGLAAGIFEQQAAAAPAAAAPVTVTAPTVTPLGVLDAISAEPGHDGWTLAELLAEAHRRQAQGP